MISFWVLPSGAAGGVVAGSWAIAEPADGDQVEGSVGLAVAAGVEAVAAAFAGAGRDRARAADRRERGFALEAVDVLAARDEHLAGVAGGDAQQRGGSRRGGRDERLEVSVELGDLVVEEGDPAREAAQRELRGADRLVDAGGVGTEAPAQRGLGGQRLAGGELLTQVAGRGEDQVAELDHRGRPGLDRALARDAELSDRFDDPGRLLGADEVSTAERVPCGQLGVDRVALAAEPSRVRVRLVDLEHFDALGEEMAGQAGGVGSGRFHADAVELAEATQPSEKVYVAAGGHGEGCAAQQRSAVVDHRGVMAVGVCVDTADDDTARVVVHALHRCPSLIGGTAGRVGGHNSDEALSQAGSYEVTLRLPGHPSLGRSWRSAQDRQVPAMAPNRASLTASQIPSETPISSSLFDGDLDSGIVS